MEYNLLLDIVTELGYRLAMCGAETYRVEESINRITESYGVKSEAFAITNCLTVSIETPDGKPITKMKRIGQHGNDLDSVERYNALSRRICQETPSADQAMLWLDETEKSRVTYNMAVHLLGNFLGAAGFAVFFGGNWIDCICAGICGILVGIVNCTLEKLHVNAFFKTIAAAFLLAFSAYGVGALGLSPNIDAVIIGALMILVPGLLFTNAMRDIIFGDTNSGINRIVQVLLIAAAIALGTGAAWNLSNSLFGVPTSVEALTHPWFIQALACFVGCVGFFIIFNIHGPGAFLCALGGVITWAAYEIASNSGCTDAISYFIATLIAASYAETMARVRRCPAICYLVVSIFPLIPGAGIYNTTSHLVSGRMEQFTTQGLDTIAIAGAIAVGILIISTIARMRTAWIKAKKNKASV